MQLAKCPVPITTLVWDAGQLVSIDILDRRQFDTQGRPLASVLLRGRLLAAHGVKHAVIHRAQWDAAGPGAARGGVQGRVQGGVQGGLNPGQGAAWALDRASLIHKVLRDAVHGSR